MSNQSDNFDFDEFAVAAIRYIDSIRSYGAEGSIATESRINAFYRILGLPAIVPSDERELPDGRPDPFNNGNIHDISFASYKDDLDLRQGLYDKKISDKEAQSFLDFNDQEFKASISTDSAKRRIRGTLFPMVVDGRIRVLPQSRRVGGAFMTAAQLKHDRISYQKPLIEAILSVKLKGQHVTDGSKQSDTNLAFKSSNLESLIENAEQRINQTLNIIAHKLEYTLRDINRARRSVGSSMLPTVVNIAEKRPEELPSETLQGELDVIYEQQFAQEVTQNSVLSLFEFNDSVEADGTRNLVGGGITSLFLEMLVPKAKVKKKSKRIDRQYDKAMNQIRKGFRSLDLLMGTFSSLSGVDIMIVIAALYRLEPEYLVGLLNKESQQRIKNLKGNIPAVTGAQTLSASLDKLKTEVTKIFDELEGHVKTTKHDEKVRNQDSEEESQ